MPFNVTTHRVLSRPDDLADPHNTVRSRLMGGAFRAELAPLFEQLGGFTEPWDGPTSSYAVERYGVGPNSIMRNIVARLFATGAIGGNPTPEPPPDSTYPGQPSYDEALADIYTYGMTTETSVSNIMPGPSHEPEGAFYVTRYWQAKLTPETSESSDLMLGRGLYRLPKRHGIGREPALLWRSFEKKIAQLALAPIGEQAAAKTAAQEAFQTFDAATRPAPGTPDIPLTQTIAPGIIVVNQRHIYYRSRLVIDNLVLGNLTEATLKCSGLAWLLGDAAAPNQSLYEGLFYPGDINANTYRRALGLPLVLDEGGGGFGVGGGGGFPGMG